MTQLEPLLDRRRAVASERSGPIRVLVVEDHDIVRKGLVAVIGGCADMVCCGEVASAADAVRAVTLLRPDVVLLDLQLGAHSGRQVLQHLSTLPVRPRVLVLSMADEHVYARALLREGADGYLMKSAPTPQIPEAIRRVADGLGFLSQPLLQHSLEQASRGRAHAGVLEALTEREREILERLARGLTLRDTARELAISEKTVDSHLRNIREKLGLRSSRHVREFALAHSHGGCGGQRHS
jgi:DNA-binding NarL/FixJ family response regulator